MLTTSPHVKQDKPYTQSPQYKKPHPYNPEASISLKNSINLKDFQFNEELEYYKNRSADLEQYVRQLKNELDTTIIRLSKQGALDEKVELVLHQNQLLSQDLDKLQKSFAQKKTECELWKSKYEQQLNSSVQLKAQYELDLRKLSNELKILEERNSILEKERNHDVEATKTNFSIQNEQQRHSYLTQIDLLENQLRKVREYADIRDKELYDLENKLTKVLQEREFVEGKLLQENDLFRIKLQEQERDNQIEMNNLRQKLDILNQGQLDNIKNQYLTQVEIMDNEIEKLKGLLDIKNTEIETLIIQNQRLRANYEEEIQNIRMQFDVLKEKMLENEQQFQEESQQMENNLRSQHEIHVDTLKKHHSNQTEIFDNQINHLKGQVLEQTQQLDELQKIRQQLLQANLQDQENATNIIDQLKKEIQTQSDRYQNQIKSNFEEYQLQKQELKEYNNQQQQLIEQLQQQIHNLNSIIALKDKQLDATLLQYRELNNQLNNRLNELHQDNESAKSKFNVTVNEQELQLNKQLILIKQLEQKLKNAEQANQNEKQRFNKLNENQQNHIRQKDQLIVQLRAELQAANENLENLDNELKETRNISESQINDLNYEHQQLVESQQISQNEEVQTLVIEWQSKEKQYNEDIAKLRGDLRTQQTLNSDLNSRLTDLESKVQGVVNDQDIIKQYEVLSQVILTNRLQV